MNTRELNTDEPDSGYRRLEDQIAWYDNKSGSAQRWYKYTKSLEFICAAFVPILANVNGTATAIAGGVVIVLEGLQQLNQWQHNWITYRSTCEALRHEKYSFLAGAGVYDGLDAEASKKLLTERVEALISTEHAKWISRQEYDSKKSPRRKN